MLTVRKEVLWLSVKSTKVPIDARGEIKEVYFYMVITKFSLNQLNCRVSSLLRTGTLVTFH